MVTFLAGLLKESLLYKNYKERQEKYVDMCKENPKQDVNAEIERFFNLYPSEELCEVIFEKSSNIGKEDRNFFYKNPKKCMIFGLTLLLLLFVIYLIKSKNSFYLLSFD